MTYYVNKTNNLDLFNDNLFFSNFFNDTKNVLTSDIVETENEYQILVDVPGFNKEDVKLSLENRQLTVTASKVVNKEEKQKFLRKERFVGTYSRKFYVGDIKQEYVKASIENGVLTISFAKDSYKKVEENKFIQIN